MNYVAEIGKKNKAERIAAEALARPSPPRPNEAAMLLQRKHDLPAASAAGKRALVACYNETGLACLSFLLRAQLDEVGIAFQHAIDLGVVGLAVDFALALLGHDQWPAGGPEGVGVDVPRDSSNASGTRTFVAYGSP